MIDGIPVTGPDLFFKAAVVKGSKGPEVQDCGYSVEIGNAIFSGIM